MNQCNINLLDLPTEILLTIFKKLDNMDVLYSLFDVNNQRLDNIIQENISTNTLNFVLTTLTNDFLSISDPILDRFCTNILPKIHYNVKSLTLNSLSMERILLVADYSNLCEIKIFNFNSKIASRYFTVQSPCRRLFQRQITDLILVFENYFNEICKHYTTDNNLSDLKYFYLQYDCLTDTYNSQILPLLRRMSNIEVLNLHLTMDNQTTFIDEHEVLLEHEFFIRIVRSFPLLKILHVINLMPQSPISNELDSNDNELYSTIIKFPYLTTLNLQYAHRNYIEQFLNDKKTHLPHLTKLTVGYYELKTATRNFTNDRTRLNCMKVKQLNMSPKMSIHSEDFYAYFPSL
ncbi:unnamed protein product [Rotaria sordida]|uniref:F-box domain-containing protein n=2 Tax=Rotaria sordida TaxID=392033 RepID=A0A819V8V6_9BILA|nr:unnamed protein product [Rotaria sordida]